MEPRAPDASAGVSPAEGGRPRLRTAALSLAALGVVFGDIGTSPLYAVRECFGGIFDLEPTRANVLGVLSLILWSLILIVCVKYLGFVLRADNDGEGGILALMALVHPGRPGQRAPATSRRSGRTSLVAVLGLFGAALLFGDGMITPAISVLGATEGLRVATPGFGPFVVPLTLAILAGLFLIQWRGTATVGRLFGPVILVWFLVIAALGLRGLLLAPEVTAALNPAHAALFLALNGWEGLLVLGGVFLVVTGAEALYADMGHFGARPIRAAWFGVAFPALVLNYFGQGALILARPEAVDSPFYRLAPSWGVVPLVGLATLAAIIASQAIISGAFSLALQSVQLGYWPRTAIRHTSAEERGQIYVPFVNWALLAGTLLLVLSFRSSSALAGAYGIAVTMLMIITSLLLWLVARDRWRWPVALATAFVGVLLVVETGFLSANAVKLLAGGWVPLLAAAFVFLLMATWRRGRRILGERLAETAVPIAGFLEELRERRVTRVRGNAIYMTGHPRRLPPALVKNLAHNHVLHMKVALMSIVTEDVPRVPVQERVELESLGHGFYQVVARHGFMDRPDAVEVLRLLKLKGLDLPLPETTFFLGGERLVPKRGAGMSPWRVRLFTFMSRNAQQVTSYFRIPPDRVIEVGSQVSP